MLYLQSPVVTKSKYKCKCKYLQTHVFQFRIISDLFQFNIVRMRPSILKCESFNKCYKH